MKAVIQKVSQASVTVDNVVISSIQKGYSLLVGIGVDDTMEDAEKLSKKIVGLRVFEEEIEGVPQFWRKSVKDINGEILSVSQFTLMARTKKGTKPDLHLAQKGHIASEIYEHFLQNLRDLLGNENVKDGKFGAMMSVSLTNEGPITLLVDTKDK